MHGLIDHHQEFTMTHFPDRFLMVLEGGAAIEYSIIRPGIKDLGREQ